ncbi:siderophore-interacting protein [Aeromicrobium endophyticum]|uniref:Siderophore-interacting protein n=1 Tax=Aeromicrobium endophyticum TaxID=2292704 RepID=A0A371P161_9ACTN|nr:siderophore-interacting protein [Aeromicrobium endophyticum]REK69655.1 siderophore-interacting protein [Aeromicrobium endophyticum]
MAAIRDKIRLLSRHRGVSIDGPVDVLGSEQIAPSFRRVVVRGDCLAAYEQVLPADGFKIDLGTPEAPAIRGFTVRGFDLATRTLHFDVHVHADGIASTWARQAGPGSRVRFLGFRRDFAIGDDVGHHVLVADASAVPALARILEAIPAEHRVVVLAETPTRADLDLLPVRDSVEVHAVVGGPSVGPDSPLATAAVALAVSTRAEYWVSAETTTVRAIRRHLLDAGLDRQRLHATAYWVAGRTSSQRDDDEAVTFDRAARAGLDVDDPAVYDLIEFEGAGQPRA